MTPDRLDALIRNNFPATDIPATQVDRVVAGVFARLDQPIPATRWQAWLSLLNDLAPSLPSLLRQSAVPAGIALMLGLYAGRFLQSTHDANTLASLIAPSSMLLPGY